MDDATEVAVPCVHASGFVAPGSSASEATGVSSGIVLPSDDEVLSDAQRILVAAELGFSETAFVTALKAQRSTASCDVSLRYFSPTDEVELSTHASVACIGVLHERNLLGGCRKGTLHTRAGAVRFEVRGGDAQDVGLETLDLEGPLVALAVGGESARDAAGPTATAATGSSNAVFIEQPAPTLDAPLSAAWVHTVERALFPGGPTLTADSPAGGLDPTWPPRVASTGLRDLLVAVSPESLTVMAPDMERVAELSRRLGTVGVHAFCPSRGGASVGAALPAGREGADALRAQPSSPRRRAVGFSETLCRASDYCVRNFAPLFGIDEEAATASSNCALACALWASGAAPSARPLTFAQGEALGAPSCVTVLPPPPAATTADPSNGMRPAAAARGAWVGGAYRVDGEQLARLDIESLMRAVTPSRPSTSLASAPRVPTHLASPPPSQRTPSQPHPSHTHPLGLAVPSPAGCAACKGAKRGLCGETFCRRCGRPYRMANAADPDNGMGVSAGGTGSHHSAGSVGTSSRRKGGWCDAFVGSLAIRIHRMVRGTVELDEL